MRILLLNQCFHPDTAATALHATDLARELTSRSHEVTVLTGRQAYGRPGLLFPAEEVSDGIRILRVSAPDFGKQSRWRRALSFACFLLATMARLGRLSGFDLVIAMTSPPLISYLAARYVQCRGGRLHLWVMDLNPDEAVAAGWLRADSLVTRVLQRLLSHSLHCAERVVVLDRFMKKRIVDKGVPAENVSIIPPWSRGNCVRHDPAGRVRFREEHGLSAKFVLMYSGNHSPCHPLDTVLEAAARLRDEPRFAFCFVGGGSQHGRVRQFAEEQRLSNILCLPYQPEDKLSGSLSAADLHVVVMGDPFLGIVHPSKIYNVLALGVPILYVGPSESHVTDLAPPESHGAWFYPARHGEVGRVVDHIRRAEAQARPNAEGELAVAAQFEQSRLVGALCGGIARCA